MNLDELKSVWKKYDEKILSNNKLSERLIKRMVQDQSKGVVAKMRRETGIASLYTMTLILFFTASIVWNAFDFTNALLYIPMVLYIVLASIALAMSLQMYGNLNKVNLNKENLHQALTKLIGWRQRYTAVISKVVVLTLLTGILFVISMTARKFDEFGPLKSTLVILFPSILSIVCFVAAHRFFNLSRDAIKEELLNNLKELEEILPEID